MSIISDDRTTVVTPPTRVRASAPVVAAVAICALAVAVIVVQQAYRTPWGLPGHRGIFWLTSLIAARWAVGHRGVAVGVAASSSGILLWIDPTLGRHVLPLLAGGVLVDLVVSIPFVRRHPWTMIVLAPAIHLVNIVNPFFRNLEIAPLSTVLDGMWFYIQGHLQWGVGAGVLGVGLGLLGRRGLDALQRISARLGQA